MDHFFHLLWVLRSWSRKNNPVNIQNYIFCRADWWKCIRLCCLHMSLLLSPQLISETVLGSPGIVAIMMDTQSAADQKCDFCPPKHRSTKCWICSVFWMRLCYKGKHLMEFYFRWFSYWEWKTSMKWISFSGIKF